MAKCCPRHSAHSSTNSKLAKGGPQLGDGVHPKATTNFRLSLLPSWKAFANQRVALVGYFDQMAPAIRVLHEPQPACVWRTTDFPRINNSSQTADSCPNKARRRRRSKAPTIRAPSPKRRTGCSTLLRVTRIKFIRECMKSRTWIRVAAGLLAVFASIHALGALSNNQAPGADKVIAAMRAFHFDAMGTDRTAFDFFQGLGLLFSTNLAILTVLAWQVGDLSETDPVRARPLVATLAAASALIAILCCIYFFIAPIVLSALAAACLACGVLTLSRSRLPA
jgi:hypothetical protein